MLTNNAENLTINDIYIQQPLGSRYATLGAVTIHVMSYLCLTGLLPQSLLQDYHGDEHKSETEQSKVRNSSISYRTFLYHTSPQFIMCHKVFIYYHKLI